jgi:hypothetical protein
MIVACLVFGASARAAAPANDDFADATALPPTLTLEKEGTNVEATKEAGEPSHAGNAGGHSVWYSWTPSVSGQVGIKAFACFSEMKPLVAVYTGSAVNSLSPVADNGNPFSAECFFSEPSAAEFNAHAGTTYWIAVDGRNGTQGTFNLKLEGSPTNDDFADAKAVTPESSSTVYTNKLATKEAEEPDHAGDPGGHSVWFKWTPSASETATISTCSTSSNLDALLAVYIGTELGNLTEVASNDDALGGEHPPCKLTDSGVTAVVTAGTTYWIAVDGSQGTAGKFNLRIQGRPSNDDFASPLPLSSSLPTTYSSGTNVDATRESEEPDHAGDPGGHSVWFSWTPTEDVQARISICFTSSNFDTLLAVYTGTELGSLTEVASNDAAPNPPCGVGGSEVIFDASKETTYMIAVDGGNGSEGNFSVNIEPPPGNDDFADAKALSGLPVSISGTTVLATKQAGEPDHAGDPGGHSVWFKWTSPLNGSIAVSTCSYLESGPDTLLAVYTGTELGDLTEVASNDDSGATCHEGNSAVRFGTNEGTTYWIAVDAKGGAQGIFSLDIEAGSPANDAFATPQALAPFPIAPGGSTAFATKQAGEPDHAGDPGGHSVWFEWTPGTNGPVDLSVCGLQPGVDTLLAVYTGTELGDLTEVASNDDSGARAPDGRCEESTGNSEVVFEADAGTDYQIAIDTKGSEGRFALDLERGPANDDFADATALEGGLPAFGSGITKLATKESEEPDHAGDPGGHSVWFKWTPEETESVSVAACTYKTPLDTLLAVYTGTELGDLTEVASNDNGDAGTNCPSTDSDTEFTATAGTTYWIAVDGEEGSTGLFQLLLEGAAPNDDFGHAQPLGGALPASWQFGSNRFATKQLGEPDHAGDAGGASVWFKWTAPRNGAVSVDTCGSRFDTLLAVYMGAKLESLAPVASNDGGSGKCAPASKLSFPAAANTTYRIAVDGKSAAEGGLDLHIDGRPGNDDFEAAEKIPGSLGWYWPGATTLATKQAGEPGDPGGHSVWYSWTPRKSWTLELDACAKGFDPLLDVYTGGAVNSLTAVSTTDTGGGECEAGSGVEFTALAGTTYRFAIDGSSNEEGHFELHLRGNALATHSLTVAKGGFGSGTVSSSPAGIECGTICSHDYAPGTAVTLTAIPAGGSAFAGWSGAGCSGAGTCQVTLSSDTSVSASFVPQEGGQSGGGPSPAPAPPSKPPAKRLRCKAGFRKTRVHGKLKCVKKKRRHHRHRG